jgi:hypothetical protein
MALAVMSGCTSESSPEHSPGSPSPSPGARGAAEQRDRALAELAAKTRERADELATSARVESAALAKLGGLAANAELRTHPGPGGMVCVEMASTEPRHVDVDPDDLSVTDPVNGLCPAV